MPPVSFSTLACPDWTWPEIVERGRDYGYDGVEVRMIERDTDLLARPEFAPGVLDTRRAELERAGFCVCGLASSVRFDSPDPAERARQVELGVSYLRLARELGATFIRVFGDTIPPGAPQAERQTIEAGIADGLQSLGERAEEINVDVLIETHGDYSDSRLLRRLFDRISARHVGVVWDTHHPWRFFNESIEETFERLGAWVRHTHWKDSQARGPRRLTAEQQVAEAEARRLMAGHRDADYVLFGAGEFPAVESLRVLRDAGYNGWLSYEWEKAWHPEIAPPDEALPTFPAIIRQMWDSCSAGDN